jgi:hypothetical protein
MDFRLITTAFLGVDVQNSAQLDWPEVSNSKTLVIFTYLIAKHLIYLLI